MSEARPEDGACEAVLIHGTRLAAVRRQLPDENTLQAEAERFRALGDPTRLRILLALSMTELCVCDIAALVGVTQTSASQHLKVLRAYDLVRYRKQGRMAIYRLADAGLTATLSRLTSTQAGGAARDERKSG